jgi:TonB-linked SusC/RagA family outer membrane protein
MKNRRVISTMIFKTLSMHLRLLAALLIAPLLFAAGPLAAQSRQVKGKVTSAQTGEALAGVTVRVIDGKHSSGTVTDGAGDFSVRVSHPATATLMVSYLGYTSRVVPVSGKNPLDITLQPSSTRLNEMVVIGYGTQKKGLLTGAVSRLENHNLDEMADSRLDNALEGKIAGLTIQNVDNEAGAAPKVRVRGTSSISANADPLVVVDGTPVPDGLAFVDPYDVASIEVLKDAASCAIYGSRGANGVILITTKEGTAGKPKFTLKAYYGVKSAYELNPIMTFSQYVEKLYREAALRENDPSVPDNKKNLTSSSEKAGYIIENQITGRATDWQREALRNAGIYNMQLGISGGKSDLKYYLSANLQRDEGLMKFSRQDRASVKARINGRLSKKLRFDVNFNPSYAKTVRPGENFTDYYRFYSFLPVYHTPFTAEFVNQNAQWADLRPGDWAQARHFKGLSYQGIMPDGSLWQSSGPVTPWSTSNNTPLSVAARINRYSTYYRMLGGGSLTYTILPGLDFKTSVSGYYNSSDNNTLTLSNAKKDGDVNSADLETRRYMDLLWENTLNYTRQFGGHHLNLMVGYTAEATYLDTSSIFGENFPTDNFKTLNQAGQIDQSQTYTLKDRIGLISYLGRAMYDYKGKYLVAASLRTDGSSYFARGRKFGWFPSVSAGWVMTDEPFLKPVSWLSNLKLRVSYGATGNNKIASFAYEDLLYPANYDFGAGTGSAYLGLSPDAGVSANPLITWERTFEYDAGLDIGLLNGRIGVTLDYYDSRTDRLLLQQTTMSFTGSFVYWNNAGSVRNQGVEIDVTSTNIDQGRFNWTTSFNLSANRNRLVSLGGVPYLYSYGERNEVYAAIIGKPSIQFFGYKTDGVWTSQDQIDAATAKGLTSSLADYFQPGGLRIRDMNGDNKIDAADRVPLGNPFPDFTWGITNRIRVGGFDLSVLIQGSQGGQLINGDAYYNETKKFNRNFNNANRWVSAANPGDGKTPYFTNGTDWMLTDYVMESASYAALRNVILGYTLPAKLARKILVSGLRVYVSADNLLYLMGSSYKGINPEARTTSGDYGSPLIDGYQRGAFPISRDYTAGIDLNF